MQPRAPALLLLTLAVGLLCVPASLASLPKVECEGYSWQTSVHHYRDRKVDDDLGIVTLDGGLGVCPDLDGDGHREFGLGGASLLANAFKADMCWGADADHAPQTPISVFDDAAPDGGVAFVVYVDSIGPLMPDDETCGDFEADRFLPCVDVCTPSFGPGLDGAYHVSVQGAAGLVYN